MYTWIKIIILITIELLWDSVYIRIHVTVHLRGSLLTLKLLVFYIFHSILKNFMKSKFIKQNLQIKLPETTPVKCDAFSAGSKPYTIHVTLRKGSITLPPSACFTINNRLNYICNLIIWHLLCWTTKYSLFSTGILHTHQQRT